MQEAVEDIISRGISELRKNAFGDDIEDAKTLPWSREQAWVVLKQLSKQEEVRRCRTSPTYDVDVLSTTDPVSRFAHGIPLQGRRDSSTKHGACRAHINRYTQRYAACITFVFELKACRSAIDDTSGQARL